MDFAGSTGPAPCVLCRTCANWPRAHHGQAGCAAGRTQTPDPWGCDHYVREFRPLHFLDRRRQPRNGGDRRKRR